MRRPTRSFRRNGEPWLIQELRAGRVTPEGVRRRTEELRTEFSDALFFKYPPERTDRLRDEISAIDAALEDATKDFYKVTTERAAAYSAEIRKTEDAVKMRSVVVETTPRQRLAAELERLRARLRLLQKDESEAIRFRDPKPELDRLAELILDTVREIHEVTASLEAPSTVASNPRRTTPAAYVEGVRRDLAAGKITLRDVARRLTRYRKILEETLRGDDEARLKIRSLISHITALESLVRKGAI